jgi:hypothetical protein
MIRVIWPVRLSGGDFGRKIQGQKNSRAKKFKGKKIQGQKNGGQKNWKAGNAI